MSKIIKGAVALGVAAGVAYGIKEAIDHLSEEEEADNNKFLRMLNEQCVFDEFDPYQAMTWFEEKQKKYPYKTVYMLTKVTDEWASCFDLGNVPDELDQEHTLLQVLVDQKSKTALECRLVSYVTLPNQIRDKFLNSDFLIIEHPGE